MKKKTEKDDFEAMQDAFIREVDEDLKNENMKKLWDKYGLHMVVLVVVALSLAVGFEGIKAWHVKKIQTRSDSFAYALNLEAQKKYQESNEMFDFISGKDYGIFVDLAKMQKANSLLEQDKKEEAFAVLAEIIDNKKFNPRLRHAAIIKLASYKLDSAPTEEVEQLLSPISSDAQNSWYVSANDLLALLRLRDGKKDAAIEIYNNLLENANTSEEMKIRIKNIISIL